MYYSVIVFGESSLKLCSLTLKTGTGYIMCVMGGREVVWWGFGCIHSLAAGLAQEQVDRFGILICDALWKGADEIIY